MTKKYDFGESLKAGLKYPWNRTKALLNIFWVFLPILGWFGLVGYSRKIVQELVKGNNKELPIFGNLWDNFVDGLRIFILMIPTILVLMVVSIIPFLGGLLNLLISIFILPWLTINFFDKGKFEHLWEVDKAFDLVVKNINEYVVAYIKTFIYGLIYGLLSLVLIGIPASTFGKNYFLAEFYRKFH